MIQKHPLALFIRSVKMWSGQLCGWRNNLNRVVPFCFWGYSRYLELFMDSLSVISYTCESFIVILELNLKFPFGRSYLNITVWSNYSLIQSVLWRGDPIDSMQSMKQRKKAQLLSSGLNSEMLLIHFKHVGRVKGHNCHSSRRHVSWT